MHKVKERAMRGIPGQKSQNNFDGRWGLSGRTPVNSPGSAA